ncbi:MAG: hypothetical protein F6K47_18970 [Symploca sp. SIO2E6]|nr:hypothetical protein [Symploca sp. SIO2E6]
MMRYKDPGFWEWGIGNWLNRRRFKSPSLKNILLVVIFVILGYYINNVIGVRL